MHTVHELANNDWGVFIVADMVQLFYINISFVPNYHVDSWHSLIIIIIIYTTYIAPYIWPVWPFIGAEEGYAYYIFLGRS